MTPEPVERYYQHSLRSGNRQAFVDRVRQPVMDQSGKLGQFKALTLVLWGESDAWIPLDDGRELARRIPGARLITYAGAVHVPMEDAPDRTVADVLAFMREEQGCR